MASLILYMKPACHLCQNAAEMLRDLSTEFNFTFHEVNILEDPKVYEEYCEIIPVVEMDGKPLLAAPFNEAMARKVFDRTFR